MTRVTCPGCGAKVLVSPFVPRPQHVGRDGRVCQGRASW